MDIRTMIVILTVLSTCSALVIIFIHKLHFSVQGTLYWACGLVTIACSLILLAFRGILPDFITIVFANTATAYGYSIILSGMRVFAGRSSRLKITLTFPLVIAPFLFWYSQVSPSLATRIILVYLMIGTFSGAIAYELLSKIKGSRPVQCFVGYIFAVNAASSLIRIILTLVYQPSGNLLKSGPVTIGLCLWSLVFLFLSTTGIILMISEKLHARQKMEEASLRESEEKLMQSNRKLQDFAFIASHDLQEPLRKIIVFGNLLKSRCNKSLSEQGRDFLERMQNAAERMQSLINGLLAFSRVSTQEQPFVSVDLNQVAKDVLSDLEVPGKRVDSLVETDPLPVVDGDPLQMRQLFQNLISNGLKFCEPGVQPKVRIYSKQEDEGPNPAQAGYCRIMVQDNGIGFEEKYTDRIFEVFQRLHGRGKYKGTGMGLAICRRIVERHKGSITAKSFPGQGALFIVTLPVKQDFKKEMQNE